VPEASGAWAGVFTSAAGFVPLAPKSEPLSGAFEFELEARLFFKSGSADEDDSGSDERSA
jgi:hypothetical protein